VERTDLGNEGGGFMGSGSAAHSGIRAEGEGRWQRSGWAKIEYRSG